ncbi:MAG: 3-phosphoserine/phosphohydroxythreonine transaminase [Bacteroidales bacterium]|nr:3-phosphoserine/phosphohydroxythreonine transaminase [Bacteroidales bacterium]
MAKHNFFAGPSILPEYTVEETAKALKDFNGTGISLMCMSHRDKSFDAVMNKTVELFKQVLDIPAGYSVIFLGGGASLQFAMVPMNLLRTKAFYLNTGTWANKAEKEAKLFGEVVEVSSKPDNYTYIPKDFTIPTDCDYMHITTNNTIFGTEILEDFNSPIPVVADTSSDIFSRPLDVSKYGLIYGGAQKNLSCAGVTFVIVKDELLGKVDRPIPTMLNYKTHIDGNSMFNTPPVVPIFAAMKTLEWIQQEGGVKEMERRAIVKSTKLYDEIDRNKLFKGTVQAGSRSRMSVCFVMNEEYKDLESKFLDFVKSRDMVGLKGHRSVGGFRASLYNALPEASVDALIQAMQDFEKQN